MYIVPYSLPRKRVLAIEAPKLGKDPRALRGP